MLSRFAPNDIVPLRQVNPAGSDASRILRFWDAATYT